MSSLPDDEMIIGPVRCTWVSLFKPRAVSKKPDAELKYQITALVPAGDDLSPYGRCVQAAMAVKNWDPSIRISPSRLPLKPCEEKPGMAGYLPGWKSINLKSQFAPQLIYGNKQPILDEDAIFPGCWVHIHAKAFAWDHELSGKGVSFSLIAVQLIKSDERLDGRRSAGEVFGAIDDAGPVAEGVYGAEPSPGGGEIFPSTPGSVQSAPADAAAVTDGSAMFD